MAKKLGRASTASVVARVQEHGNIYFAYRPKIDKQVATGLDDVQRLYVILSPRGRDRYRLIVIGEKRLPAVGGGGDRKTWGFVEKVSSQPTDVEDELDPKTRLTKTRGERHIPAARPVGEGVYSIVQHRGHTHLAYALELPREPGEVQRALNIVEEGNYTVAVKNPTVRQVPGMGVDEAHRARFPKTLQGRFRGRRFIPLDPPDFLDYEGAEILLVGAKQNARAELGIQLDPEQETEATAEIFSDLRLEKAQHPLVPLLEGKWA
jgi:hypothetical protein